MIFWHFGQQNECHYKKLVSISNIGIARTGGWERRKGEEESSRRRVPSPPRRAAGPCLTLRDVRVAGWAGGAGPARSRRRGARGRGGCETRSAVRHGGGCSVPLKPLLVQQHQWLTFATTPMADQVTLSPGLLVPWGYPGTVQPRLNQFPQPRTPRFTDQKHATQTPQFWGNPGPLPSTPSRNQHLGLPKAVVGPFQGHGPSTVSRGCEVRRAGWAQQCLRRRAWSCCVTTTRR